MKITFISAPTGRKSQSWHVLLLRTLVVLVAIVDPVTVLSATTYSPGVIVSDSASGWATPEGSNSTPQFQHRLHQVYQIGDSQVAIGNVEFVQVRAISYVQRKTERDSRPAKISEVPIGQGRPESVGDGEDSGYVGSDVAQLGEGRS